MGMKFSEFSKYLARLDETTSRNSLTEILSELFKETSSSEIREIVYLLDGRIVPLYDPLKFHVAEKTLIRALAVAYEISESEVKKIVGQAGDVGSGALVLSEKKKITGGSLTVREVYKKLYLLAEREGEGSVEGKIQMIVELVQNLDPLSVKYVLRIPLNKMRLGFSAMTVLDAFSWSIASDKSLRGDIERAYNVRPDLGYIGEVLKKEGTGGLEKVQPEVFTPILMARAERLSSSSEIIAKIGACAVESKIDGFRLQVHKKEKEVRLFTRSLEDVTFMYPDVVESVRLHVDVKVGILEGEVIAYDNTSGRYLEFQMTSQRKRKYQIEEMAKKIPLRLVAFDVLYVDGKSFLKVGYIDRHAELERIVKTSKGIVISEMVIAQAPEDIESEFTEAVASHFEGVMVKRMDGVYQAGARGWNWIKFKASYQSRLNDTVDAVVMGYYLGRGKRNSFGIGAFLIGVYDKKRDVIVTVAKVGTGLTDVEWRELKKRGDALATSEKPALYEVDRLLVPDVWIKPSIVVEVKADELTRSALHTAGRSLKASKSGKAEVVDVSGYALRFPRLERFRDDKQVDDATSLEEIESMFDSQRS